MNAIPVKAQSKPLDVKNSESETLNDWLTQREKELVQTYGLIQMGVEPITHCPTGLRRLDDAGLLELGVATIVLGHEGDGKSALGLQFLEGCAKAGFDCHGYYPEDPKKFIADRVFSPILDVSSTALRRGKVDDPGSIPARLRAARQGAAEWTARIRVNDKRLSSHELLADLRKHWTKKSRLGVIDYAQVMSAEDDEKSVERVINRLVWDTNEFAKEVNGAIVILSQVRGKAKERGQEWFGRWKYNNAGKPINKEAVEGYRPISGDGQWAPNALGQKARAVLSWFRPHQWMRELGAGIEDNVCEAMVLKNNYGASKVLVTLRWDGPTTRITDPRG